MPFIENKKFQSLLVSSFLRVLASWLLGFLISWCLRFLISSFQSQRFKNIDFLGNIDSQIQDFQNILDGSSRCPGTRLFHNFQNAGPATL